MQVLAPIRIGDGEYLPPYHLDVHARWLHWLAMKADSEWENSQPLSFPKRRIRGRMYGGVGGEVSNGLPYPMCARKRYVLETSGHTVR